MRSENGYFRCQAIIVVQTARFCDSPSIPTERIVSLFWLESTSCAPWGQRAEPHADVEYSPIVDHSQEYKKVTRPAKVLFFTLPSSLNHQCYHNMNPSDDDKVRDLDIVGHNEDVNHLRNNQFGALGTRGDAAFVAGKQDIDIVDEVLNRVAEDDVMAISESSLVLQSRTGLRIAGIMLVMGVNQAAYGVDWAVMGNINAYATWHNYFGFGDTGAILATINALSELDRCPVVLR